MLHTVEVLSQVLPFRVNQYILDELIDWDNDGMETYSTHTS